MKYLSSSKFERIRKAPDLFWFSIAKLKRHRFIIDYNNMGKDKLFFSCSVFYDNYFKISQI